MNFELCPLCAGAVEQEKLIAHVRHQHTSYDEDRKVYKRIRNITHDSIKKKYNEIAISLIKEASDKEMD